MVGSAVGWVGDSDGVSEEAFVGSSIQFRIPRYSADDCRAFVERAKLRGVELKWFGAPEPHGFTSTYASWQYAARQSLPKSDAIVAITAEVFVAPTS